MLSHQRQRCMFAHAPDHHIELRALGPLRLDFLRPHVRGCPRAIHHPLAPVSTVETKRRKSRPLPIGGNRVSVYFGDPSSAELERITIRVSRPPAATSKVARHSMSHFSLSRSGRALFPKRTLRCRPETMTTLL